MHVYMRMSIYICVSTHASVCVFTQAAVAEVLSEADVSQLCGSDAAHLQRHSRALPSHFHPPTHTLHLQHQHRHLGGREALRWIRESAKMNKNLS
jgi:hypothetical protein